MLNLLVFIAVLSIGVILGVYTIRPAGEIIVDNNREDKTKLDLVVGPEFI